jgi:hypothetical protein
MKYDFFIFVFFSLACASPENFSAHTVSKKKEEERNKQGHKQIISYPTSSKTLNYCKNLFRSLIEYNSGKLCLFFSYEEVLGGWERRDETEHSETKKNISQEFIIIVKTNKYHTKRS